MFYDLSLPLGPDTAKWPGDPDVALTVTHTLERDGAVVRRLTLGTHTGTHIDAPAHVLAQGAGVDELALASLIGSADVVHLPTDDTLSAATLQALAIPSDCRRLLLRTRNSDQGLLLGRTFRPDYVALSPDGARWLVERDLLLVGIDALSVDPYHEEAGPAHLMLLGAGVVILEGLYLGHVPPGRFELVCLPLRLVAADGAPARAVLLARDETSP